MTIDLAALEREALIRTARDPNMRGRFEPDGVRVPGSLEAWCELAGPGEAGPFKIKRWQSDLCDRLQEISLELQEIQRAHEAGEPAKLLLAQVESPTQVGKSEIVIRWMSWHMATFGQSVAFGSYASDLAERLSSRARAMLRSWIAREIWPHLRVKKRDDLNPMDDNGQRIKDSDRDWSIPARDPAQLNVCMVARGREGGLNGRTVWLVVPDDLLKNETEALSAASRDEADSWVASQAMLRVQERGGAIVMVGSRWHIDDPHARQRERAARGGTKVRIFSYPLKARANDLMNREPGEYLTPGWTPEYEAEIRANLQTRSPGLDRAILDCDPIRAEGALWKRPWFAHAYIGAPHVVAKTCARTWLAIDGAETAGGGDWSVLDWWGIRPGRYLKLWQWREQVEFPDLLQLARRVIAEVRPTGILVEKKSSGKGVYQTLVRELPNVIGVEVDRSKAIRYRAVLPSWQGGGCEMPDAKHAPWLSAYVERMLQITGEGDEVDDEADTGAIVILHEQAGAVKPSSGDVLRALTAMTGGRR